MLLLRRQHIVDLYLWVEDLLPKEEVGPGRPALLTNSELVTLLIWNVLTLRQKTLKDLHRHAELDLRHAFPHLPQYSAFVDHCHRVLPLLFGLLQVLLCTTEAIRIVDSTMLPVCKLHRAKRYKVAKDIAQFGKNHQGWHYGFKLHASVDLSGRLCGVSLTPANVFDAHQLLNTLNEHARVVVGDTTYGASVMRKIIWETYGTFIIAPPHPKQTKKVAAPWQIHLLNARSKIESSFDILKEHLNLVSSFPRSPQGYLLHYVRILLAYQILALASAN
jgi:hypothetical protein